MIKIVLTDDHQALIDGIKLSIVNEPEIQIVGEANDGNQVIEVVKKTNPDVLILDIRMPNCDGFQAAKMIKKNNPKTKIIIFSMFDQLDIIHEMKTIGVEGYLLKNAPLKDLVQAIKVVHDGYTYFDGNLILQAENRFDEEVSFSNREREIIRLIGVGHTSLEISNLLSISKNTVDTHRKNILKKLGNNGKNELIKYAVQINSEI
uniref:response regulator n=1 Tax=Flavobacterium sp. TaxID=239 RepID=UPI00404B55F2